GKIPRIRSALCSMNTCINCATFDAMLKCDRITPFGSPVEPLEKITVAVSSGVVFRVAPQYFCSKPVGKNNAPNNAASFSKNPGSAKRSSAYSTSPGGWTFTFSKNNFDVTVVFSPHCFAQDSSDSRETV